MQGKNNKSKLKRKNQNSIDSYFNQVPKKIKCSFNLESASKTDYPEVTNGLFNNNILTHEPPLKNNCFLAINNCLSDDNISSQIDFSEVTLPNGNIFLHGSLSKKNCSEVINSQSYDNLLPQNDNSKVNGYSMASNKVFDTSNQENFRFVYSK